MAEAGFLKAIYDSLAGFPVLQAAVGALILIFGLRLMMKADKVKEASAATVAPAPMPPPDTTQLHLQGSVAHLDIVRETRDLLRDLRDLLRDVPDSVDRIAECTRIIREEVKRQTEILSSIEREQDVQGRSRNRHHDD